MDTTATPAGAEEISHCLLRLVADHPGRCGRLRAARIVGGYTVPLRDDEQDIDWSGYQVYTDWPLRELTRLVDALLAGGFIVQTPGPRPVLVLKRLGFRTLDALEAVPHAG